MDISEAETGIMKLSREPFNLAEAITDIVELYRYAADEKRIALKMEMPSRIGVSADIDRIRQVLSNLLDNAIKYTPAGGSVKISGRCRNDKAVITISDTGIGIPEEDLRKIWDRLFRGDQSRSEPGLGLGLSLVKAIVRAHGGTVSVESIPGKGSDFSITLGLHSTDSG